MMEARQTEERMIPSLSGRVDCNGGVTDVVENDSKQRDGGADHVSPLVEPSDDLVCREVEVSTRRMDQLKCLEERYNSTSRRPHKRSRCGGIIGDKSILSSLYRECVGLRTRKEIDNGFKKDPSVHAVYHSRNRVLQVLIFSRFSYLKYSCSFRFSKLR